MCVVLLPFGMLNMVNWTFEYGVEDELFCLAVVDVRGFSSIWHTKYDQFSMVNTEYRHIVFLSELIVVDFSYFHFWTKIEFNQGNWYILHQRQHLSHCQDLSTELLGFTNSHYKYCSVSHTPSCQLQPIPPSLFYQVGMKLKIIILHKQVEGCNQRTNIIISFSCYSFQRS